MYFFLICVIRLSFHVAEHESDEEESEGDYSESLLDDASPTTSSVQLNAVTALLASDQLQQPNPLLPYPSDVQVHSSTHVISAANIHLEGHSQPQHASVQSVVPTGSSRYHHLLLLGQI